jgi:GDPmannose 4,6-dehydratase
MFNCAQKLSSVFIESVLASDPTKAKEKLGWVPEYDLQALIKDMMASDLELMKKDVELLKAGHKVLRQVE